MANNPLDEYPGARKALYLIQWITTGVTGVLGLVYTFQGDGNPPHWYTVTVACLAFVWAYTGITAQGNTPAGGVPGNPDPPQPNEGGAVNWILICAVCLVLLVLFAIFGVPHIS